MSGTGTALCAAISIGDTGDGAPEWLHLLPAGSDAYTADGRGPYRVLDPAAVIKASMASGKLALDENHATDLAAPKGKPAPARGWIVEMQQRADGVWGRVEWTPEGQRMMAAKEYRGVSPVILHRGDYTVTGILRASLTNTPNLTGLKSLHSQETVMDFRKLLIEALGLGSDAGDDAIAAGVKEKLGGGDASVSLQAALAPIAKAAGVAEDADAAAILAGITTLKGGSDDRVVALQSEVATLTTSLDSLAKARATDMATVYVDGEIKAGRVGLKPVRAEYISMHAADPAKTEKLIAAMPVLSGGSTMSGNGPASEGSPENPALLAAKGAAYQTKMKASGVTIDFAAAVRAVADGKDKVA